MTALRSKTEETKDLELLVELALGPAHQESDRSSLLLEQAQNPPPMFTLTPDVPTVPRPSTVSMLTTRVPTGGTPQPNVRKNGSVRETPADKGIEPGIGIGK